MAKVTISFSPGPDGYSPSHLSADGETSEVEAIIEAVNKLKSQYPIPKQQTKSVFPTDR